MDRNHSIWCFVNVLYFPSSLKISHERGLCRVQSELFFIVLGSLRDIFSEKAIYATDRISILLCHTRDFFLSGTLIAENWWTLVESRPIPHPNINPKAPKESGTDRHIKKHPWQHMHGIFLMDASSAKTHWAGLSGKKWDEIYLKKLFMITMINCSIFLYQQHANFQHFSYLSHTQRGHPSTRTPLWIFLATLFWGVGCTYTRMVWLGRCEKKSNSQKNCAKINRSK